jgi:hypothetical protein
MKYSDVQKLLDDAIGGANVNLGFHHAFWRTQTRDQFVAFSYRGVQLIVLGNPNGSGLVWALEGTSPFGKDNPAPVPNATFNRMPDQGPYMSSTNIKLIRDWIQANCPV